MGTVRRSAGFSAEGPRKTTRSARVHARVQRGGSKNPVLDWAICGVSNRDALAHTVTIAPARTVLGRSAVSKTGGRAIYCSTIRPARVQTLQPADLCAMPCITRQNGLWSQAGLHSANAAKCSRHNTAHLQIKLCGMLHFVDMPLQLFHLHQNQRWTIRKFMGQMCTLALPLNPFPP